MIIGLTGRNASGKGTVAEYLQKQGFSYFSLSDELRKLLEEEGIEPTRRNLIKYGNMYREERGDDILAQQVMRHIRYLNVNEHAVVDSIRNVAEVNALKQLDGFILVAVEAPIEERFKRAKKRGSARDQKTLHQFKDMEAAELTGKSHEQQLAEVEKVADFIIKNDSDLENLYKKSNDTIQKILHDSQRQDN